MDQSLKLGEAPNLWSKSGAFKANYKKFNSICIGSSVDIWNC